MQFHVCDFNYDFGYLQTLDSAHLGLLYFGILVLEEEIFYNGERG
jgi:hypothetical protein